MLNKIWASFFLIAFVSALLQLLMNGDTQVFVRLMESVFSMSRLAFEISLGLVGVMAFWLGMMKIGEQSGFLRVCTAFLKPLLQKLFPSLPSGHPVMGSMLMNLSSNALGLDNAATPLGLKAMKDLQTLNPEPETATDAQILFLVLNTSSVTLFPVTVFAFRAQQGAANPTDVFIPILFATFMSTLTGLVLVAIRQKLDLCNRVVLAYLGGLFFLMTALLLYFMGLEREAMQAQSAFLSNFLLFSVIAGFIAGALIRKVNVFETFVSGAKEGFEVAVTIIPYLVAMLVGIGSLASLPFVALEVLTGTFIWPHTSIAWTVIVYAAVFPSIIAQACAARNSATEPRGLAPATSSWTGRRHSDQSPPRARWSWMRREKSCRRAASTACSTCCTAPRALMTGR